MVDIAQITQYFNLGLLVVFISLATGLFFAGLRGFTRGIWKSTHNMVFMLSLVFISFFTLNYLTDIIGDIQISPFYKAYIYISREIDGEMVTYYVPLTTVKGTLTEFIKGFYTLYNVSASAESAANFAIALAGSVLKVVIFIVDMILIMTLGNLFSFLTWFLIFQHFIPKVARKLVKIRWVGMIETAVTYLVITVLFMTPLTSLLNSLNQSYQKNPPTSDNEMVQNIGNFVDAYNQSLFAKILFNWTVDENGTTFDTRLFDRLTTSVSGEYSIGLVGEISNLTNVVVAAANGISSNGENEFTIDTSAYISKEIVDLAFDAVINSDLLTTVIPVVVEIALNSDLLEEYIPNRLLDLSDVEWKKELGYVKDMVDCVFDSGAVEAVFTVDEEGRKVMRNFEGNDLIEIFEDIIYDENFYSVLDIFKSIDNSKVLTRAVPAVLQFLISNDEEGTISQYLPFSWQELNEFSWGFESYILLDFLHSTVLLDDDFFKAIFIQAGLYQPAEDESIKALPTLIAEHVDEFKSLVVGEINDAGELVNVDSRGQTIVFQNGTRIENRNYCLFDMNLIGGILPSLLDNLFEQDFMADLTTNLKEGDLDLFHATVDELNNGVVLKNYKIEFNSILDIVATLAKDEDLLDAFMNGDGINSLMTEEGDFFSIDETHIDYFRTAIEKVDDSKLLYSALAPILKSYLLNEDTKDSMNDFGLRTDILASAIDHDLKASDHTLFADLASVLLKWDDLKSVSSLSDASGDTDDLMEKLKDRDIIDSLVSILNVLHDNPILNPTPEAGEDYEKNENIYGLLDFVFSNTEDMGLKVERETMREVTDWNSEFESIGDILHYFATHEIIHASDAIDENGMTRGTIERLKEPQTDEHPENFDIPGLFKQIDGSHIFSESLGPFLDETLGDSMNGFLVDKNNGVTFSNVTNWSTEGDNIKSLLDSMYRITPEDDEEAKDFLSNLDINTLSKVVDLNDMLHDLAHSGIFYYVNIETGLTEYKFGEWLYGKINDSMGDFTVDENAYDLLADPKPSETSTWSWETTKWGVRPEDGGEVDADYLKWKNVYNADGSEEETHYIAYKDFIHINNMAVTDENLPSFWCNYDTYVTKRDAFLDVHEDDLVKPSVTPLTGYFANDWGEYYASDDFITDYSDVFDNTDEISRVVKFMCYSMRVLNAKDEAHGGTKIAFNEIDKGLLDGLLTSLNDTYCLRIGLYNFYRIAAENVFNTYSGFSLSSAYNPYMVDSDVEMFDFEHGRPNRQEELDKMIEFYDVINLAKEKGIMDGGNFQFSKMNDDEFMDKLEIAMKGMNDSYVFHRKGTAKVNEMTTFQGLFNHMLGESETKNVIFIGEDSPKDAAELAKGEDVRLYNDGTQKIKYLVTSCFLTDSEIPAAEFTAQRDKQQDEIHTLIDSIQLIYSLKDKEGETVTAIDKADMKNAENVEVIEDLFTGLNSSEILYDCVPNTMYNMFIKDGQLSIKNGEDSVDFKQVDPFYHYYFNDSVKRSSTDFEARYLTKDISGIVTLIECYQDYDEQVTAHGGKMSNPTTIKALTGEGGSLRSLLRGMHDCNIFHTPARNWSRFSAADYYTNKFGADKYTLFEEMMGKICSFVKLDTFAYDADYAPDVANFGSAANKLQAHVKAVTLADDNYDDVLDPVHPYYHTEEDLAWYQEIDAMMNLAYTAGDLGETDPTDTEATLDVSSFELDKMAPQDVKRMLVSVNASDLVSDAVPGFVSDGFDAINLGNLTEYGSVNYAVYHLGQEIYGGANALAGEGTEIDNLEKVLEALYGDHDHDVDTPDTYATNMSNMTQFVKDDTEDKCLPGLIRFIYNSHIFNTSLDGEYDVYNLVDRSGDGVYRKISARGILLYNSFGEDLRAYIARRANDPRLLDPTVRYDLDKMSSLSVILNMESYGDSTYLVESRGIKDLIFLTDGNIDASTFAVNNIETIKAKKNTILGIVEAAYNVYGVTLDPADPSIQYQRSAIVSEFISGVFNNILENQYNKITTTPAMAAYDYVAFSFGNDNASTLTFGDYDSLGEIERDGLDGVITALDYLSNNPATMRTKSAELKACFTLMGRHDSEAAVQNNSWMARALYLTEAHNYFKALQNEHLLDSHDEQFNPVDETSVDHTAGFPYNIYSDGFSFEQYGERIETFLNDFHTA